VYVNLLTPPAGNAPAPVQAALLLAAQATGKGEAGEAYTAQAQVALTYASRAEEAAAPKDLAVMERYSGVNVAEAANEALKLERQGENEAAARTLTRSLELNRPYLNPKEAEEYQQLTERMRRGMDEMDRKASHSQSYLHKQRRES